MTFPWIKRSDLMISPHDAGGWMVKDPLTLQYAHLEDSEFQIFNLLDGQRGFNALLADAKRLCPAAGLTADDIAEFLQSLAKGQLIRQTTAVDGTQWAKQPALSWFSKPLRAGLSLLRVRIRLLNPSRIIDAAMPLAAPLFAPIVIRFCVGLIVAAAMLVMLRFGEVTRQLPTMQQFLGPQNLVLLLAVFIVVKILHEAGHAFTAQHFGAECSECGVMLMMFTPVLYTNVSDSWLLPRRQRMLITAAGMFVELTIAAVCTVLWWYAQFGATRFLLLNTMLVCSINTLLFNGNPLLRFDGYYLLTDWLGVPNLAQRASSTVRSACLSVIVGRRPTAESSSGRRGVLLTYGILAAAYRLALTLVILQLVNHVAADWQLRFLGSAVSFVILTGFVGMPLLTFAVLLSTALRDTTQRKGNVLDVRIRMALCGTVVATLLLIPLPQSVVAPAFVQPTSDPVYTALPGRLQQAVSYGTPLKSRQTIAKLQNGGLDQIELGLKAEAADLQLQLDALLSNPDTATSELLPQIRESLTNAAQRLQQFADEAAKLTITSPEVGVLLPPPSVAPDRADELPQLWHGVPLGGNNANAWLERGTLLGYVGSAADVRLFMAIGEDDVQLLKGGQTFRFLPSGVATKPATGVLGSVNSLPVDELPIQFAVTGLVNGQVESETVYPSAVTYPVFGELTQQVDQVPPALYSTGRVRIQVQSASLLRRFIRYLRRTF